MKNNKGFSLVELIVVIAIMAILAAVAIPTFATFIKKANVASDVSFINDLTYSAELAHAASGDKVSAVMVTVKEGVIEKAYYEVSKYDGTPKGTVMITAGGNNPTITVKKADGYTGFVVDENEVKTVIDTIDWSYKFKSEKDGTFQIATNNSKALAPTTPPTMTAGGSSTPEGGAEQGGAEQGGEGN